MKFIFKTFWMILFCIYTALALAENTPAEKQTKEDYNSQFNDQYPQCASLEGEDKINCFKHQIEKQEKLNQHHHKSASEQAQSQSQAQLGLSMLAIGSSVYTASKVVPACSDGGTSGQCAFWVTATIALGATGGKLFTESQNNNDLSGRMKIGDYVSNGVKKEVANPDDPLNGSDDSNYKSTEIKIPFDPNNFHSDTRSQINNINSRLRDAGVYWDSKSGKIKMPDGREIPTDPDQIKTALDNLPPNAVKAFKNHQAKLKKQIQAKMNQKKLDDLVKTESNKKPTSGSGGGGFKGYASSLSSRKKRRRPSSHPSLLTATNLDKTQKNKFKNMAVQVGKHPVGIAQNNIFQMVHQRYQTKRKANGFVK